MHRHRAYADGFPKSGPVPYEKKRLAAKQVGYFDMFIIIIIIIRGGLVEPGTQRLTSRWRGPMTAINTGRIVLWPFLTQFSVLCTPHTRRAACSTCVEPMLIGC